MSEIARFYMYAGDGYTVGNEEHEEGEWVTFTDHEQAVSAAVTERDTRIKELADRLEELSRAQANEFGNYITSAGRSGEYKEGRADAYDDAAGLLRSLLSVDPNTEKEARS